MTAICQNRGNIEGNIQRSPEEWKSPSLLLLVPLRSEKGSVKALDVSMKADTQVSPPIININVFYESRFEGQGRAIQSEGAELLTDCRNMLTSD